jgi:hypothetical protein
MPFYTSFPWKENIILTVYSIEDPFLKNYLEIKWELCPQRFHGKIVCFFFWNYKMLKKILMYNFASLVVNYVLCLNFIKVTVWLRANNEEILSV